MMWARIVEVMVGCWLALSPFIFRHAADQKSFWFNDLTCAFAVIALALLSFWSKLRLAHLAIIAVAFWLIGFGFLASPYPPPPALQNNIMVGLLLLMFAIIPNEVSLPPEPWSEHLRKDHLSSVGDESSEQGRLKRNGVADNRGAY